MTVIYIILGILKIIGIVLLLLLGLLLVLMIIILTSAIAYTTQWEKQQKWKGSAKITWLFKLFAIFILKEEEKDILIQIFLFGIKIYDSSQPKKVKKVRVSRKTKPVVQAREKRETEQKSLKSSKKEEQNDSKKQIEKQLENQEILEKPHTEKLEKKENTIKTEKTVKQNSASANGTKEELTIQTGVEEKKQPTVRRIKMADISEKSLKQEAEKEKDSPKEEPEPFSLEYFKQLPNKKELLAYCFAFIKKVVKRLLPQRITITGEVGTGDPAYTGYVLAGAGILNGLTNGNVHIKGNFERIMAEGTIFVKGKLRLGSFLWIAVGFITKKPVFRMIRLYWKGKGE